MLIFLIVLTVTFFGLMIYSIIQENMEWFGVKNSHLFSLKILNTESSASLFVTLLGALLVRNQFVLGLRPRVSYKSDKIESGKAWRVKIKNAGLGAAIINRCEFLLETEPGENSPALIGYEEVIDRLAGIGLVYSSDFTLGNISKGFTFPPQEEYKAFKIKTEHFKKIQRFNMILHFQGFLGDRYYRNIVLIPKVLAKTHTESL